MEVEPGFWAQKSVFLFPLNRGDPLIEITDTVQPLLSGPLIKRDTLYQAGPKPGSEINNFITFPFITTTTTTTTSLFLTLNIQISHHLQIARLIEAGGV